MMILPLKISIFCRAPETFAGAYFYINEAMLQHKIRILPLTNDDFGATRQHRCLRPRPDDHELRHLQVRKP